MPQPEDERDWLVAQRKRVIDYLCHEELDHSEVPADPVAYVQPNAAIWLVGSKTLSDNAGWWIVTGNLPTSWHVSAEACKEPQEALLEMSRHFRYTAAFLRREAGLDPRILTPYEPQMAERFEVASDLLLRYAEDDEIWGKKRP